MKKSTKTALWVIGGVIVVGGLGYWYYRKKKQQATKLVGTQQEGVKTQIIYVPQPQTQAGAATMATGKAESKVQFVPSPYTGATGLTKSVVLPPQAGGYMPGTMVLTPSGTYTMQIIPSTAGGEWEAVVVPPQRYGRIVL